MALLTTQEAEERILKQVDTFTVRLLKAADNEFQYNVEANVRVKLDDSCSIGSLLAYDVYGNTLQQAVNNLLNRMKEDEEKFKKLRSYYSLEGKDISKIVLNQNIGKYTIVVKENEQE